MQIISLRDFRLNQTKYLELVKKGEDVILKSRSGSFKIQPIGKNDIILTKSKESKKSNPTY